MTASDAKHIFHSKDRDVYVCINVHIGHRTFLGSRGVRDSLREDGSIDIEHAMKRLKQGLTVERTHHWYRCARDSDFQPMPDTAMFVGMDLGSEPSYSALWIGGPQ